MFDTEHLWSRCGELEQDVASYSTSIGTFDGGYGRIE
jgi:hypothetical protein